MRILITGGTGYIGYNLTKYLVEKGYYVNLLVRSSSNLRDLLDYKNINIHHYNDTYDSVKSIFLQYKIDYIYHLASNSIKSNSLTDFELIHNVTIKLTYHLLTAAIETKQLIGFINVGTFWQLNKIHNNIYTLFKGYQDELCRFYSNNFGIKVLSLLLTDTYGKNDWRPKILNQLNKSILEKKSFHVNNPDGLLELIYIDDVCIALYQSMDILKSQELNYDTYKLKGTEITTANLVLLIEDLTGIDFKVTYGLKPHSDSLVIKNSIRTLPRWVARVELETGLKFFFGLDEKSSF
jgi:CDP-paratose synthetase